MDLTVISYAVYLPIATGVTVWVARTLSRNGKVFLADVFRGDEKLADAVNHLLVVGFYLVNLGFVALWMRTDTPVRETKGIFDALSVKLGTVLLVLGLMHLANVAVLGTMRRRGLMEHSRRAVQSQPWPGPATPAKG